MRPTDEELQPVLDRLREAFKQEAEPREYAKSLREVFDDYTLLLLEQKEDRSYMVNALYDIKKLSDLLHED